MGKKKGKKKKEVSLDAFLEERKDFDKEEEKVVEPVSGGNDFSLSDLKEFDEAEEGGNRPRGRYEGRRGRDRPPLTVDQVKEPFKLFMGELPFDANAMSLGGFFQKHGIEVVDMNVPMNHETGKSKGFAFVTFKEEQIPDVLKLQGGKFMDRSYYFDVAEGGGDRGGRGGRGRGGYRGRGGRGGFRGGRRYEDNDEYYRPRTEFKGFGTERQGNREDYFKRKREEHRERGGRGGYQGGFRSRGEDSYVPPKEGDIKTRKSTENIFGGGKVHVANDDKYDDLGLVFNTKNERREGEGQGRRRNNNNERNFGGKRGDKKDAGFQKFRQSVYGNKGSKNIKKKEQKKNGNKNTFAALSD